MKLHGSGNWQWQIGFYRVVEKSVSVISHAKKMEDKIAGFNLCDEIFNSSTLFFRF